MKTPKYILQNSVAALLLVFGMLPLKAQTDFTEENAFLLFLRHDTLPADAYTEEFIYRFQRDKYYLIRDDEFEKRRAARELKERVDALAENTEYSLEFPASFGDYDFDRQGFVFQGLSEDTEIKIVSPILATRLSSNVSANLVYTNASALDLFPLDENQANMLLKERKNYKNGKVDRSITLKLFFTVDEMLKSTAGDRRCSGRLIATLRKVEFLAPNQVGSKPLAAVSLVTDEEGKTTTSTAQAQKSGSSKGGDKTAADQASRAVIEQVEKLLSNSELSDELKATLIKSTIQYYETKQQTQNASLYRPQEAIARDNP